MKRLNRDTIIAVVLLLFCGLLYQQTFFVRKVPFSIMGSEVWPRFVLIVLFVLLAIYLFQSLVTPPADDKLSERPLKVWVEMYRSPLWCFGMFFLFLVVLPYLGMLISGVLFVFITQTIIGYRDPRSIALHAFAAVTSVGGMWAVFRFGLGVVMPAGSLF